MGVDHTSGTDTKTETTDRPLATDTAYEPPPDRPGSPGQPSRAESRAAARAPAETESGAGERAAEKPEPEKPDPAEPDAEERDVPQAVESPEPEDGPVPDDDQDTPRGPRAESRAQARETQDAEAGDDREPGAGGPAGETSEDGRAPDGAEAERVAEPAEAPEAGRGPRAESWARAIEAQKSAQADAETSDTEPGDPPGREPRAETDDGEPLLPDREPGTADETGRFAELPTRADLDPAGAGELTRERGDPLAPVNHDQDLREPERNRDSGWKKAMRGLDDNLEEAAKEFTKVYDNAQGVLGHRPPNDYRPGVQHDNIHPGGAPSDTINAPSAGLGIVAVAMIGIALKHGMANTFNKIFRRGNDDNG